MLIYINHEIFNINRKFNLNFSKTSLRVLNMVLTLDPKFMAPKKLQNSCAFYRINHTTGVKNILSWFTKFRIFYLIKVLTRSINFLLKFLLSNVENYVYFLNA